MARGTQLIQMVKDFRAEIRESTNVAMGQGNTDQIHQLLRRVQEEIYDENDWTFLDVWRDESLVAGSRYYTVDADLSYERIRQAYVKPTSTDRWYPVEFGIYPEHLNEIDSDNDDRQDYVRRWNFSDEGDGSADQIEVWPIPVSNNQTLRLYGKRDLGALTDNAHTSTLDGTLIVMYAASERLTKIDPDRSLTLFQKAERRKKALLAQQQHSAPLALGTGGRGLSRRPRPLYGGRI